MRFAAALSFGDGQLERRIDARYLYGFERSQREQLMHRFVAVE